MNRIQNRWLLNRKFLSLLQKEDDIEVRVHTIQFQEEDCRWRGPCLRGPPPASRTMSTMVPWGWHRKFMKLLDNQTSPFLFKNIRPSAPITPKEPYAVGPLISSHILYYYISTICFKTLLLVTVIIVSPLHLDFISIASYSNHISITSFFIPLVLVSIYKCNAIWSTAVHWGLSALSADLYYNFPFNSTFPPTPLSIILTSFCNVFSNLK